MEIIFVQAPLGGASSVQIMDQLIADGAKQIIATGCCGALIEGAEGEFFIPTAALRHGQQMDFTEKPKKWFYIAKRKGIPF